MRPVQVINNSISGVDLRNLVDNYVDLWDYIHQLLALLGDTDNKVIFNELKKAEKEVGYYLDLLTKVSAGTIVLSESDAENLQTNYKKMMHSLDLINRHINDSKTNS